jgi:choline dehydrogenase
MIPPRTSRDQSELARAGIDVVQHLSGVGQNFQDHIMLGCVREYRAQLPPRNGAGPTFFWKSNMSLDNPDLQSVQLQVPVTTLETAHFAPPAEIQ